MAAVSFFSKMSSRALSLLNTVRSVTTAPIANYLLPWALDKNMSKFSKFLIALGADIDKPINGYSKLYTACAEGDLNKAKFLVELGANPNAFSSTADRYCSPLHKLVEIVSFDRFLQATMIKTTQIGAINFIMFLVNNYKADLMITNSDASHSAIMKLVPDTVDRDTGNKKNLGNPQSAAKYILGRASMFPGSLEFMRHYVLKLEKLDTSDNYDLQVEKIDWTKHILSETCISEGSLSEQNNPVLIIASDFENQEVVDFLLSKIEKVEIQNKYHPVNYLLSFLAQSKKNPKWINTTISFIDKLDPAVINDKIKFFQDKTHEIPISQGGTREFPISQGGTREFPIDKDLSILDVIYVFFKAAPNPEASSKIIAALKKKGATAAEEYSKAYEENSATRNRATMLTTPQSKQEITEQKPTNNSSPTTPTPGGSS